MAGDQVGVIEAKWNGTDSFLAMPLPSERTEWHSIWMEVMEYELVRFARSFNDVVVDLMTKNPSTESIVA